MIAQPEGRAASRRTRSGPGGPGAGFVLLALVAALLAGLAGCRAPPDTPSDYEPRYVELEAQETAPSPEGGRLFLAGARVAIAARPAWRAVTLRSVETDTQGGARTARRRVVERVVELAGGDVWTREDGGAWRGTDRRARELARERARRASRLELLDRIATSPELAALEDLRDYLGDGAVRVEESGRSGDARTWATVAAEPGIRWQILLRQDGDNGLPAWLAAHVLAAVLDLDHHEARRIASALPGFPVRLEASVLPEDGGEPVRGDWEVLGIDRLEAVSAEEIPRVPDAARQRRRGRLASLDDAGAILERIAALAGDGARASAQDGSEAQEPFGLLELIARLEPLVEAPHLTRLETLWTSAEDFDVRVELLRLALRRLGEAGRARVEAAAASPDPALALAAAEALVAEAPAPARELLRRWLLDSEAQPAIDGGELERWVLRQFRLLDEDPLPALRALHEDGRDPLWNEFRRRVESIRQRPGEGAGQRAREG